MTIIAGTENVAMTTAMTIITGNAGAAMTTIMRKGPAGAVTTTAMTTIRGNAVVAMIIIMRMAMVTGEWWQRHPEDGAADRSIFWKILAVPTVRRRWKKKLEDFRE